MGIMLKASWLGLAHRNYSLAGIFLGLPLFLVGGVVSLFRVGGVGAKACAVLWVSDQTGPSLSLCLSSGGLSLGLRPLFFPATLLFGSVCKLFCGSFLLLLGATWLVARNQFWECVLLMWYFTPLSELNSFWHSKHLYFPTAPPPLLQFAKWALSPETLE